MTQSSVRAVRLEINSLALEDLPIKLLIALKLDRSILSHRHEEDRPACATAAADDPSYSFDRAKQPGGRPAKRVPREPLVPVAVRAAAVRFCAGCPLRARCGLDADSRKEEGLWGGEYRFKESNSRRYVKHDVVDDTNAYLWSTAS